MTRRRLLRRPPQVTRWPRRGLALLLVGLVVAAAVGIVAADVRPQQWPPASPSDQWAAEGALFAAGAFLLTVIATLIAVVAYVNSVQRPRLTVSASHTWDLGVLVSERYPYGYCDNWKVSIRVENEGPVAARYLAVSVTLERATLVASPPVDDQAPWRVMRPLADSTYAMQWEGGADAVVHPGWSYTIEVGPVPLRMYEPAKSFVLWIDVIADETPPPDRVLHVVQVSRKLAEPLTSSERHRRAKLLEKLEHEYGQSDGWLAPDVRSGECQPPLDFVNDRLEKLGESWRVWHASDHGTDWSIDLSTPLGEDER